MSVACMAQTSDPRRTLALASRPGIFRLQTLDTSAMGHSLADLQQPDRHRATLASLRAFLRALCTERSAGVDGRAAAVRREAVAPQERPQRRYAVVEARAPDSDGILTDRWVTLKPDRDRPMAALHRSHAPKPATATIDPALVERFESSMRENVANGGIPFRTDVA